MSVIEGISRMSNSGCDDDVLMNYVQKHFEILDCELNGDRYKESKKHNNNFCIDCNLEKLIDYQKSVLVCTNCGLCEYYPVYVTSYNHTMKPLRSRCIYKRLDNFKVILNQFFYGGKQLVSDNVMNVIRNGIHNRDNILCNYTIPLTIPILECILKRNKMMKYKNSIYYIFFKLNSQTLPYITTKEYYMILNVFNIVSSIYDRYEPKGRKSFLNYFFVLTQILIVLGKIEYTKYILPLKTRSKQKELERV